MIKNRIAFTCCVILLLFCSFQIGVYLSDSKQTEELYTSLREEHAVRAESAAIEKKEEVPNGEEKPHLEAEQIEVENQMDDMFLPLIERNEDTVGWLLVPNTGVDYPVVQTTDNMFYLEHNFDGNRSNAGAIFMDYRNVPGASNRHTIIYGHNMRDGSMFKGLEKYKGEAFFRENPYITLFTLEGETTWEIFSAYVTGTDFYYIATDFRSSRDYASFLKEIGSKSLHERKIELSSDDAILSLSTCSYELHDARFVVHAKRIK